MHVSVLKYYDVPRPLSLHVPNSLTQWLYLYKACHAQTTLLTKDVGVNEISHLLIKKLSMDF